MGYARQAGLAVGLLFVMADAASGQQATAPAAPPPAALCVTNSCVKTAQVARDQPAIDKAIAAGKAGDVYLAGGTAAEGGQAFRKYCENKPGLGSCSRPPVAGKERWASFANGQLGLAGPNADGGFMVIGDPSMLGVPAPAEAVEEARRNNAPDMPQPIMVPQIQSDGSTRMVTTGFRFSDGRVLPLPQQPPRP